MEPKKFVHSLNTSQIPTDWEINTLSDCLIISPTYGLNAAAEPFSEMLPKYLRITDITFDGRYSNDEIVSVSAKGYENFILEEGDLVFARTGASVGKSYLYDHRDGTLVFAGYLIRVRTDPNKLIPDYLKYFVQSKYYWDWVTTVSMRSGQPGVNATQYGTLAIFHPSKIREQRSIVEVLSDVDVLIETQEALIEKKRLIKQGVMQELLTGQKRLPGFTDGWKHETLENVCTLETGKRPKGGVSDKGDIPSLGGENIYNENGLNLENINKVSAEFFNNMNQGILNNNDVLINKDGANTGKVALYSNSPFKEACVNEHIFIMRGNEKLDNNFLYYLLCHTEINLEIKKYITSSAQPGINRSFTEKIVVKLPPIIEQQAIAKILIDIEIEIDLHKKYKVKIESIKQGMMQELLTGRTRLV